MHMLPPRAKQDGGGLRRRRSTYASARPSRNGAIRSRLCLRMSPTDAQMDHQGSPSVSDRNRKSGQILQNRRLRPKLEERQKQLLPTRQRPPSSCKADDQLAFGEAGACRLHTNSQRANTAQRRLNLVALTLVAAIAKSTQIISRSFATF